MKYLISKKNNWSDMAAYSIFTHNSICAIARICYRPSVRMSVHLSITRVYHRKTVEVRIMKFSPYSSPITLVFVG